MEEYNCGICGTFTVSMEIDWQVPILSYDEIPYHMFICSRCGSKESHPAREHLYKVGDTVFLCL